MVNKSKQPHGFVEFAPKQEGRNMTMVLGPTKKKTEAVAEQKALLKIC